MSMATKKQAEDPVDIDDWLLADHNPPKQVPAKAPPKTLAPNPFVEELKKAQAPKQVATKGIDQILREQAIEDKAIEDRRLQELQREQEYKQKNDIKYIFKQADMKNTK